MNVPSFSILRVALVTLLIAGCSDSTDDGTTPPVMSAIGDMRALQEAKTIEEDLAKAKAAQAAAAAREAAGGNDGESVKETGNFVVEFDTTVGKFTVEVDRSWAPKGADRFHSLVSDNFYDDAGFFRVVPGFMVQFGIAADPVKHAKWSNEIQDDPVVKSNTRGYVTFAKTGAPDSRTTQIFINYGDNSQLDDQGFAPFGKVIKGMDVVDKINAEYREKPDQQAIEQQGSSYLKRFFPNLDYVKSVTFIKNDVAAETSKSPTPGPVSELPAPDAPTSDAPTE